MSTFIKRYEAKGGGTVIQVVYKQGRQVMRTVHVGTAHSEDDLELLVALAHDIIRGDQQTLGLFEKATDSVGLMMQRAYPKLLYDSLGRVFDQLGFDQLTDEVFKQLVIARLIEPTSKLDTIRVLEHIGQLPPANTEIHRCLRRVIDNNYRASLSELCFSAATPEALSLLLYDVTTLYFEVQKEDGYRVPGMSKERRLEPQITVGLLVGRDGFPLEIASFEGNRAEVKTIVEVLEAFRSRHPGADITVTADAAMLSSGNIQTLEEMGYHYIIASRLAKTPYAIAEYTKDFDAVLTDGQIFDTTVEMNTGTSAPRMSRRIIYQYREKRARLDLLNIDKLLTKAQRMVSGQAEFKRNRFLKVSGSIKEINYALVETSRQRAGIKGYLTDLDVAPEEVISAYHQLFQVERSFRMTKSDLKARPVFHRLRDSIEAHLTVVFAALAIARRIEAKTQMSIKRFINTLRSVQTGVVLVNGRPRIVEPYLSPEIRRLLSLLKQECGS